ncbi:MAG TPA: hypothetical protein VN851_13705 [Thermoanaerobaculia bacterium]|nr:hypothetical protein [Thermoanaerobaculia bacterium]
MKAALEAGRRALVYCVQTEDWDRLGDFVSAMLTSTNDPVLLGSLIPHLRSAAESSQKGQARWRCLTFLADALLEVQPEASLPLYARAATEARTIAEAAGDGSRQAWSDLASISGNWATALLMNGNLDSARLRRIDCAEAHHKAGSPAILIVGSELEALRIDLMNGRAAEALPQVESRLARVETWWQRHRAE